MAVIHDNPHNFTVYAKAYFAFTVFKCFGKSGFIKTRTTTSRAGLTKVRKSRVPTTVLRSPYRARYERGTRTPHRRHWPCSCTPDACTRTRYTDTVKNKNPSISRPTYSYTWRVPRGTPTFLHTRGKKHLLSAVHLLSTVPIDVLLRKRERVLTRPLPTGNLPRKGEKACRRVQ